MKTRKRPFVSRFADKKKRIVLREVMWKKKLRTRNEKTGWIPLWTVILIMMSFMFVSDKLSASAGAAVSRGASSAENARFPVLKEVVAEDCCPIFGTGITASEMEDPRLWELVTTHFNAVTLGNELKPDALFGYSNARCPGTREETLDGETIVVPVMDFSRAEKMLDQIKAWNEDHPDSPIRVRGHVLVWHSQTPEWFFHEDYDKEKPYVDKTVMDKRQKWYIKTVLEHFTAPDSPYAGMFYGWDVVNEAISDGTGKCRTDAENAGEPLSQDTHGSNSSWWHVYQSEEFILNAFRYANQYAPAEVELYYNDYNECSGQKMMGIRNLLAAIKEQEGAPGEGTRIDAMGMQGHYNMTDPSFDKITLAIETYAAVVGKVQFTEMDLKASDSYDGSQASREEEYARQASRYRLIYNMIRKMAEKPEIEVGGITFWGIVDKYSWLQFQASVGGGSDSAHPQCPLLFDDDYQPKPAFWVFADQSRLAPDGHLLAPEVTEPEPEADETKDTEATDGGARENAPAAGQADGTQGTDQAAGQADGTQGTEPAAGQAGTARDAQGQMSAFPGVRILSILAAAAVFATFILFCIRRRNRK